MVERLERQVHTERGVAAALKAAGMTLRDGSEIELPDLDAAVAQLNWELSSPPEPLTESEQLKRALGV